jgi:small GTP-binding protein
MDISTANLPVYKVILVGDGNVGKTSLVRRYCEGRFETSRVMTIGVDFHTKVVQRPGGSVKLSIWDVAGQERFRVVRESFYRGATAAALVYDLTDHQSLLSLGLWIGEVRRFAPAIQFMVVANKADLNPEPDLDGQEFAARLGTAYLRTSAASGNEVENLFTCMAEMAVSVK